MAESDRLMLYHSNHSNNAPSQWILYEKITGDVVMKVWQGIRWDSCQWPDDSVRNRAVNARAFQQDVIHRDPFVTAEAQAEAWQLIQSARGQSTEACRSKQNKLACSALEALCQAAGLPAGIKASQVFPESARLQKGGLDCFGRTFEMHPKALQAWRSLEEAAHQNGISLKIVSAFRSHRYQAELIAKKLASGRSLEDVLSVNTLPGASEHHTGMAIDLHCPNETSAPSPLSEAFESTKAFHWLVKHAYQFGFELSYPRNNPHGLQYEPWHWCYRPNCRPPAVKLNPA